MGYPVVTTSADQFLANQMANFTGTYIPMLKQVWNMQAMRTAQWQQWTMEQSYQKQLLTERQRQFDILAQQRDEYARQTQLAKEQAGYASDLETQKQAGKQQLADAEATQAQNTMNDHYAQLGLPGNPPHVRNMEDVKTQAELLQKISAAKDEEAGKEAVAQAMQAEGMAPDLIAAARAQTTTAGARSIYDDARTRANEETPTAKSVSDRVDAYNSQRIIPPQDWPTTLPAQTDYVVQHWTEAANALKRAKQGAQAAPGTPAVSPVPAGAAPVAPTPAAAPAAAPAQQQGQPNRVHVRLKKAALGMDAGTTGYTTQDSFDHNPDVFEQIPPDASAAPAPAPSAAPTPATTDHVSARAQQAAALGQKGVPDDQINEYTKAAIAAAAGDTNAQQQLQALGLSW